MATSSKGKNKEHKVHHKDRANFDKVDSLNKKAGKGRWVTINGRHKFISEDKK